MALELSETAEMKEARTGDSVDMLLRSQLAERLGREHCQWVARRRRQQ